MKLKPLKSQSNELTMKIMAHLHLCLTNINPNQYTYSLETLHLRIESGSEGSEKCNHFD